MSVIADQTFATPADRAQLDRAAEALRANGFTVHITPTGTAARELVNSLLPLDQPIFTAASETLIEIGVVADVNESGRYRSARNEAPDPGGDLVEVIRIGATPEVVVGSVHAVTEQGTVVVGSATGSQFAPYAAGARKVIWVVGAQKLVPDLETGLRRLREHSAKLEIAKWEAQGQSSFLGKILIVEREFLPERITVILVEEAIGY